MAGMQLSFPIAMNSGVLSATPEAGDQNWQWSNNGLLYKKDDLKKS